MILYLDILFLVNFIMNYIILYFVALILNLRTDFYKLILGALLGCLFLIGIIMDQQMVFKRFFVKIIISVVMVFVSYRPNNFRNFFKILGFFYLVSFMMGGGVLAAFYLLKLSDNPLNNAFIINSISIPWWILLISALALFIFQKFLWPVIYKLLTQNTLLVHMTIFMEKKSAKFTALIDTGNNLFDPISNYPVIIVELGAIKNVIDENLIKIFENGSNEYLVDVSEYISCSKLANRFRIIPFESIGKTKGIMVGLKPDKVIIEQDNKTSRTTNKVILGIHHRVLSQEGRYEALLNPILLNE